MLNRVVLIGRLTKDSELRYTPNGKATCSFTLACDRQFKNAQGEKEADFIPCSVPPYKDKLAELCANYLAKGNMAAVDGRIQIRTYNDKDGQKRYVTEVIAEDVRFLSPKNEGAGQTQSQQPPAQQQRQSSPPGSMPPPPGYQGAPPSGRPPGSVPTSQYGHPANIPDSEIPF